MKNFPIEHEGKTYWISRAITVVGYIFTFDNGKLLVLANKRGKGTPDFQGYWNCPCGYLDFDETTREACVREIAEETNLLVHPKSLMLDSIQDDPTEDSNQNVTFRYWDFNALYKALTVYAKGAEPDEVEDVEWIPVEELDNYQFAFNQEKTIKRIVRQHLLDYINKNNRDKFNV